MPEDRLSQRLGLLQLGVDIGFEMVDDGKLVLDGFDDGFLFREGRERSDKCLKYA